MIDLLTFAFQDFWHFAGCVVILSLLIVPFSIIGTAIVRKKPTVKNITNYYQK